MMRMPSIICMALCLALPSFAAHGQTYRVAQTKNIEATGTLQILEDARLTPAIAKQMWNVSTDPAFALGDDSPTVRKIGEVPLLPAKLVLHDRAGQAIASVIPEGISPLAGIEDRQLAGAVLVTTDDSAGFGTYSGLRTHLFRVSDGKIMPVSAVGENGKSSEVTPSGTLKAQWRVVTRNGLQQILQIGCDPDFAHEKPGARPSSSATLRFA